MTAAAKNRFTSQEIASLLAEKYTRRLGEWAIFYELRNGTGHLRGIRESYIDALVMGLWPSTGLHRLVFEIKVSRGDFLNELKTPQKRQWGMDIGHEFWFVCAPGVAKPDEIPAECGLLIASKDGDALRAVKQAQHRKPRQFSDIEIAAIARQSTKSMGNVYQDLRWRWAGQEIDAERLDRLIEEGRTPEEQRSIERRANELMKLRLQWLEKSMQAHAAALKEVGVEPPDWMTSIDRICDGGAWGAAQWAKKNIRPGPALSLVEEAIRALTRVRGDLEAATVNIAALRRHGDAE